MYEKIGSKTIRIAVSVLFVLLIIGGYFALRRYFNGGKRTAALLVFLNNPDEHLDWMMLAETRCGEAPFMFPTDGYVGYLWDDMFQIGHRHQGIDIFSGTPPGVTQVYAAYDGYLTRKPDWKASVIIRVPHDPLDPDRQIWLYYTHMADSEGHSYIDEAFPPGTEEKFVKAGTLLGYQGNYSGKPGKPVGVHLHFSIVRSAEDGSFLNELDIKNTLDPSPYFGLNLNASRNAHLIPVCGND